MMPRTARAVEGGEIYHVLNRGNGRMRIFHKPGDFEAFLKLLALAPKRVAAVDVLALCLMPNHWHLVLRPRRKGDLAEYMRWLCTAHVRRHHAHYHSAAGHLYQGRYKSFPIQNDQHLLTVLRYVEANALRAGLVERAGRWTWSSDALRGTRLGRELLCDWPIDRPKRWANLLEEKFADQELDRLRTSVTRGRPYGSQEWVRKTADRLGLAFTLRNRGRPKKGE
jgi:putative transposase